MTELLTVLAPGGPVAVICGVMLWINHQHQAQMAKRLGTLEEALLEITRNNTQAMLGLQHSNQILARALSERPCMIGDHDVADQAGRHHESINTRRA